MLEKKNIRLFEWLFFFLLCILVSGCIESQFQLSDESSIPIWFEQDIDESERGKYKIVLTYYTLGKVKMQILDIQSGEEKKILYGRLEAIQRDGETYYPHREVITIDDVSQEVLHKAMEPIFYVN